jgi:hypothetical protein
MQRIADEAAARRLARAIASDIALYNEEKLRNGQSLDAEIAEGRGLFRKRVEAALFAVYEAEIENLLGPRMVAKPNVELTDHRRAPSPFAPDPEHEKSPWPGRLLLVALVLFVGGCVVSWFLRHR